MISYHRSEPIAFPLALHALAYQLIVLFRRCLSDPHLGCAQPDTLRVRLFRVGALIRQTTRRWWLHLASDWPYQELLQSSLEHAGQPPAPT